MTSKEAIQVLKEISATLKSWSGFNKYPQAIDMAIEALKADDEDEPQFYTEDDYWNGMFAESAEAYKAWTGEEIGGTSDLISRADAIKAIEEETTEAWTETDANFNRGMEMAVSIIKALPSAEAEWIPCSERLPEYMKTVIISTFWGVKTGYLDSTEAYGDFWEIIEEDGDTALHNVYAWMPLPKPYKGGDSE